MTPQHLEQEREYIIKEGELQQIELFPYDPITRRDIFRLVRSRPHSTTQSERDRAVCKTSELPHIIPPLPEGDTKDLKTWRDYWIKHDASFRWDLIDKIIKDISPFCDPMTGDYLQKLRQQQAGAA